MGTKDGSNKKAGSGNQGSNQNNNTVTPNASEVAAATEAVQDKIGFTKTKHPTEGTVNTYAFDSEGNQTHMYGGTLSTATNEYLKDIGEATYNEATGGYMLTPKGWALKYGSYTAGSTQTGSPVGGNTGGVMGNTPLSDQMFESQNKMKNIILGALSVVAPFPASSVLAYGSEQAHNQKGKYGDYLKSFQASQTANMAMGTVTNQNTETANLGMGETEVASNTTSNKKKGKTHKKTGNFFAGTGIEESTSIREFFA